VAGRSAGRSAGDVPGDAEACFGDLVEALGGEPGVTAPGERPGRERAFGAGALKVNGRIFAMVSGGRLVVKLPAARVAALVADGDGGPFDAGKGRPMKEWVTVDVERRAAWEPLAREALAFVGR
jgi:hypothetical protein